MKLPALLLALAVSLPAATFDVHNFGARGDGITLDTAAIQHAIDAAAKAHGTVVIPPGTYRTGAIFLKSGIEFHMSDGVTLLGSKCSPPRFLPKKESLTSATFPSPTSRPRARGVHFRSHLPRNRRC